MMRQLDIMRAKRSIVTHVAAAFSACPVHWPWVEERSDDAIWIAPIVSISGDQSRRAETRLDIVVEANVFADAAKLRGAYEPDEVVGSWAALFHQRDIAFLSFADVVIGWLRFGPARTRDFSRIALGQMAAATGLLQWNIRIEGMRIDR